MPTLGAASPLRALVSLETLRQNLARVRRSLRADTELIACVKANAYGHGLRAVAGCLQAEGVRWLSLGSPAEALALRRWGITSDILLFPTGEGGEPAPLLEAGITIGVQSFAEAAALARAARTRPPAIFLKVDSGLGRVGIPLAEAADVAARIRSGLPDVRLAGVFTHVPFGGTEGAAWAEGRLAEFGRVATAIRAATGAPLLVQALASAGIACGIEAPGTNAVSPGQLLSGIEPAGLSAPFGTQPVLSAVRTVLGALRDIPAGVRFGASGGRVAAHPTRLGALPIGYSNSILVQKPGQTVRVWGRDAPVLSVSLEHTVVDLSDVGSVRPGASVCLLASDPGMGPSLADVAASQGRSPLEVLVSLTGRAAYEYSGDMIGNGVRPGPPASGARRGRGRVA
jgi:alanine racemase